MCPIHFSFSHWKFFQNIAPMLNKLTSEMLMTDIQEFFGIIPNIEFFPLAFLSNFFFFKYCAAITAIPIDTFQDIG